jgi:hypothetical protein
MRTESELHHSIKSMLKEIDMPQKLIAHGASAQVSGKAREICNLSGCKIIELEKNTHFAN